MANIDIKHIKCYNASGVIYLTGNEFIKKQREKANYSIRSFAKICKISPRQIVYYENGDKSLTSISISKAIRMFSLLNCNIPEFYNQYYPYQEQVLMGINIWKKDNPRTYDKSILKSRYYSRIFKIRERNSLPINTIDMIFGFYNKCFNEDLDGCDALTDAQYDKYIISLNEMIRTALGPDINNITAGKIIKAIYQSEYSITDVANICDVSVSHLRGCLTGIYDIDSIRIILALKLCLLLKLDFYDVFKNDIEYKL